MEYREEEKKIEELNRYINDCQSRILNGEANNPEIRSLLKYLVDLKRKTEQSIAQKERMKKEKERRELEEKKRLEAEHVMQVKNGELPLDWTNFYSTDEEVCNEKVMSIGDAYVKCLNKFCGKVDIEYISQLSAEDLKTVIHTLKGVIYQNPLTWDECFYKGWETKEEYLSGNIKDKLSIAYKANKRFDGYFDDNIKALKSIAPKRVEAEEIFITLGSPWIPAEIITRFLHDELNYPVRLYREPGTNVIKVSPSEVIKHDEITGSWEIPYKGYGVGPLIYNEYGTPEMGAFHIVQNTLNMRSCVIYKEIDDYTTKSGKRRVVDEKETLLVAEKQKLLIKKFQDWVWANPDRKKELEEIYNSKFCNVKTRHYSGAYLELPGLSEDIALFPYQKDAIARIINCNNTLLAHDVGAGKTYIMIAAGMELRRLGLTKKNMYIVPNGIVSQWKNIFLQMYPEANILVVEPKTFKPAVRNQILEKIKNEDYDGIIIAYSSFEMIDISIEHKMTELENMKQEYMTAIARGNNALNALKKKVKTIDEKLEKLAEELLVVYSDEYENRITFEELGVDALFLDEAHNYKNLPLTTKINFIMGLNKNGSSKCENMLEKVKIVQRADGTRSGRVVFATGTPITNSIAEVYNMQRYLQSGIIGLLEISSFDAWVGMFAEKVEEFEVDVDTSNFRMATRFSKFHNIPELTNILSDIADFHKVENDIPLMEGYSDVIIPKTPYFQKFLDSISERADQIRTRQVSKNKDNMLKLTSDGKKGALDLRLVVKGCPAGDGKVKYCIDKIFEIWERTKDNKSSQLVFCDMYSSAVANFNVYSEIKDKLLDKGIPETEIAFISEADTEKRKNELFKKVNNGEIRVLIGSTMKLGTGVNVQQKLIAIHHLDVPWRPADMTQREGRILRQGNENENVLIFRYIMEGSFDAYSWQLLETKQKFITDLLSGFAEERSAEEVDNSVLDYGEVKAIAIGNPIIKERVEALNELSKYRNLQAKVNKNKEILKNDLAAIPGRISVLQDHLKLAREDFECIKENEKLMVKEALRTDKKELERVRADFKRRFFNAVTKNIYETTEREFEKYRGFSIHLPSGMSADNYFVFLCGKGKYRLELGTSDVGNVVRVDNFLSSEYFEKYLEKKSGELSELFRQKADIEKELKRDENYHREINHFARRLEEIDRELGVNKDE